MKPFIERTEAPPYTTWADINWHAVEGNVRRLQERIYRATTHKAWRPVKNLQKLLVRATSNTLLAIRRITQENQGNVIQRTGKHGQGLEPDEGQLSRPVLRGLVSGNTHRLPGGSQRALDLTIRRQNQATTLWYDNIMPELARFLGIIIRMYAEPSAPHHRPHFHAYYQDAVGIYSIDTIELISGALPRRQHRLVEAWAELHQDELLANWERLQAGQPPRKIDPLR